MCELWVSGHKQLGSVPLTNDPPRNTFILKDHNICEKLWSAPSGADTSQNKTHTVQAGLCLLVGSLTPAFSKHKKLIHNIQIWNN